DTVFAGPAVADLYVASDASDVHVQVSVSEVRPDGTEYLVQNGWLDIGHRAEDRRRSDGLEVVHRFTEDAYEPLRPGRFVRARIDIPSFAHAFRAGSRLRLSIATPGRNHATWEFANPDDGTVPTHRVARSASMPSALVLSRLEGVDVPAVEPAPCPGLRGQACRPFVPTDNMAACGVAGRGPAGAGRRWPRPPMAASPTPADVRGSRGRPCPPWPSRASPRGCSPGPARWPSRWRSWPAGSSSSSGSPCWAAWRRRRPSPRRPASSARCACSTGARCVAPRCG